MHAARVMLILALTAVFVTPSHGQPLVETSAPQGVTLSIYDFGLGMVNEARRVALTPGEQSLIIRGLPGRVDPSSLSFGTVARAMPFEWLEQSFQYDLTSPSALLRRMIGQPVVAQTRSQTREGILLAGPLADDAAAAFPVRSRDGKELWLLGWDDLSGITFPAGGDGLAVEPQAVWRVRAKQEGPQNFRLAYRVDGLEWKTHYELLLAHDRQQADLSARVELVNRSGGRYENARARLVLTERGMTAPLLPEPAGTAVVRPAMRYAYGAAEPAIERTIAAMAPVEIYELPRTVTLEQDRSTFVHYLQAVDLPIKRFYVYDGVRFDRFQRNRRTDWNFGTEYHPTVQLHVEFENAEKFGLGMNLPPGWCRLYRSRADGSVDLAGDEPLLAIPAGGTGSVRVGPAIGLRGERERTGYNEVRPNSVYEETFQIRLMNSTDEDAEVRVVEHLYRWTEFEIARADADYTRTGPQTIEFRVALKPATRRVINYTVRYNW